MRARQLGVEANGLAIVKDGAGMVPLSRELTTHHHVHLRRIGRYNHHAQHTLIHDPARDMIADE